MWCGGWERKEGRGVGRSCRFVRRSRLGWLILRRNRACILMQNQVLTEWVAECGMGDYRLSTTHVTSLSVSQGLWLAKPIWHRTVFIHTSLDLYALIALTPSSSTVNGLYNDPGIQKWIDMAMQPFARSMVLSSIYFSLAIFSCIELYLSKVQANFTAPWTFPTSCQRTPYLWPRSNQENYKFFFEVFWDFWKSKKAWKDRKS
jgi:hypothetical protein